MFKWIFLFLIILMLSITGILILEYKFFKEQVVKLAQIRNEYNQHMLALKKVMLDFDFDQKKKLV